MAAGYINMSSSVSSFEGRIYYTTAQSQSANTTTVSLSYQVRRVGLEGSSGGNISSYSISTTISTSNSVTNKNYTYTSGSINVPNSGSWTTIGSSSHIITHSSDGSASMSFTTNMNGVNNSVYFSAADSIPIGSIAIKPTLNSAPNFRDDDNPTITYSNPMGNGVDSLVAYILDNDNNRVVYRTDISKTGSSYTFYLTSSERSSLISALGSSNSMNVRFYIHAVIGGIGYSSYLTKTFSRNLYSPTVTASISDTKSATNTLTGGGLRYIPGNNTMTYSMNAVAQSGATITKVSVTCGNQTSNSTSGTLTNIENNTVIFSATDSNGLTGTKTIQLTPVDYVKLTCNQTVKMVPTGTNTAQMALTISGNFFNGSFGAKSNTLKLYVRYSRNGGSFGNWDDLTPLGYIPNGNTYTLNANLSGFDPSGTYTFECKAEDALMSVTSNDYAATFMPIFDWSDEDFNFNVPIKMNGETVLRHNETANNVVLSASGGFIYFRPAGTSATSGEVKITPQGNIELSGDIIINGQSLKSLLKIT